MSSPRPRGKTFEELMEINAELKREARKEMIAMGWNPQVSLTVTVWTVSIALTIIFTLIALANRP